LDDPCSTKLGQPAGGEAAATQGDPNKENGPMKTLDVVAVVLLVVGGLNWGLVGVAQFDLVAALFGTMTAVSRVVYALVGVAALYQAVQWRAMQRRWQATTHVNRGAHAARA